MHRSLARCWLVMALATVALLGTATAASPAGRIVVFGASPGSHLTLAVSGQNIVVDGYMAAARSSGCRLARSRLHAVCPVADAAGIEVEMGPNGDLVEVLDRLPFPLTVHLGSGEDKFVGNGERDSCYPEGTRRNRCIGGGGNDACVTGPRNSDCVGGGGDDYCEASTGSDGCWGGPGRDVCYMGPGQDGCHGDAGNDRLFGGPDPDQLYGGAGYDYCDGGPGIGRSHECEAGPGH
jgi:RTX calcium-binding nonapeptide repeat (4 copies)